ncbi:hypothetical protein H2198_002944 [Neophaeococcomyces mojaviensis]|uniref:Uncharacterized protein n=1 Tax=Neophaeococcomyces mojaviensis TaxID=3383035 RepID=A0ACC3AD81_9EURO|nr:hypothetical protein H2198_002944 [Knufia sp. JES_112]
MFHLILNRLSNWRQSRNDISTRTFIDEQIKIIQRYDPKTGVKCGGKNFLLARTLPNARLKTVFGIDNAFTTDSSARSNGFVKDARHQLQTSIGIKDQGVNMVEGKWSDIINFTRSTIAKELPLRGEIINLADLIQFVTLKISLKFLFDAAEDKLEKREGISYLAKTINILWIESKNMHSENGWEWKDEARMHDCLRDLTGKDALDPLQNPMNLILPGYETMWRAVFRGILEVYFRDQAADTTTWQRLLAKFLQNPTKKQFQSDEAGGTESLCAKDIVKEILRIYPPT